MENYKPNNSVKKKANTKLQTSLVCLAISAFFCIFIAATVFIFAVSPDKEQSQNENRMLEQKPDFSFSTFADGSFMKKFETYFTDQFPGRDSMLSFKTSLSKLLGSREQNGVYFGKGGFLIEKQTPQNEAQLETITSAIREFADVNEDIRTAFILSPNASSVLESKMPFKLKQENQTDILNSVKGKLDGSGISWINCAKIFSDVENKESLFYRTDHHWTTRAAFEAFLALSKTWKLGAKKNDFSFYAVSDSFSGTLASSAGDRKLKDNIEICVPKNSAGTYTVFYESQNVRKATLFDSEKLNQKNQYEVFLGGNFDKVIISTTCNNKQSLLMFKDSYANCLIPMLTPYFSRIVIIDPRYFSDSLETVLEETSFTHALFMYNLNTFLSDNSLAGVLDS